MELNNEEMMNVKGGAISFNIAALITGIATGAVTFLVGVFDGFLNPNKCK